MQNKHWLLTIPTSIAVFLIWYLYSIRPGWIDIAGISLLCLLGVGLVLFTIFLLLIAIRTLNTIWSITTEKTLQAKQVTFELQARTERLVAEAQKLILETQTFTASAPPGHQLYLINRINYNAIPLHLQQGPNGNWETNQLNHATRQLSAQKNITIEPVAATKELLPLIQDFERLLIIGGSKSGKTTIAQWLIDYKMNRGQTIVVTPHADGSTPKEITIGGGRNFEECSSMMYWLCREMSLRYKEIDLGNKRYEDFDSITIFIDEWDSVTGWAIDEKRPEISKHLAQLLREARKIQIFLCLISHSRRVGALGLEGLGDLRDSFTILQLKHSQVTGVRSATVEVVDEPPIETIAPGSFGSYQKPQLPNKKYWTIITPDQAEIVDLHNEGNTDTAVARKVILRDKKRTKPNGQEIALVRRTVEQFSRMSVIDIEK